MKNEKDEKVVDKDLEYNENGTVKLTKKLRTNAIESLEKDNDTKCSDKRKDR